MSPEFFFILTSVLSTRYSALSFEHPIRSRQDIRRNYETDLLGGFEIDHQLDLVDSLDRQILGFDTTEDTLDVLR
jgi:hypothetical protein